MYAITISPFGVFTIFSAFAIRLVTGISLIGISTGEDFFRKLSNVESIAVDASKAKQVLRGFINKKSEDAISKEEARRTAFEKEYVEKGFAFMMNKYPSPSNLDQVISFIKSKFHLK